jgi:hypothetical protein
MQHTFFGKEHRGKVEGSVRPPPKIYMFFYKVTKKKKMKKGEGTER